MIQIICTFLLIFVITGCDKAEFVGEKNHVGEVISASVVPTSFNEVPKMQINFTQAIIIVPGVRSVSIGASGYLRYDSDGVNWLCFEHSSTCWRVWGE